MSLFGFLHAACAAVALCSASPESSAERLRPFVSGLEAPLYLTAPRNERNRVYVVEQPGRIRVVVNGKLRAKPFMDIRPLVVSGGERGLLSVAFHPRYAKNHKLYVDYTDQPNGNTRVVEYRSSKDFSHVLPGSRRQLFTVNQPFPNHNGGQLEFGPDGLLYVGMGDGGAGGDPGNRAQNLGSRLGKLLRIDVDRRGARPQVCAYGLRNPWRFSFDRATNDLYIGDVGQDTWEEVDYVRHGTTGLLNFGWRVWEGDSRFRSDQTPNSSGRVVFPIATYRHGPECSVTGGYVYRGSAVPSIRGRYFYGDYCSGRIWSLKVVGGDATDKRQEPYTVDGLSSFGEDARGELYAVSLGGTVYRFVK